MPTLLVIDDEAGIRFTIREVLRSESLRVLAAENSAEGLRLAREELPDVVLLDIRLGAPATIHDFDLEVLTARPIATGQHCFGCTAGAGSSCGGAVT